MRIGVFALLSIIAIGCSNGRVLHDSDGNPYTVKVMSDGRTWTTTNLRLALPDSYCHGDAASACLRVGRLYTWASAVQGCTRLGTGWRLPTDDEWRQLAKAYGGLLGESGGRAASTDFAQSGRVAPLPATGVWLYSDDVKGVERAMDLAPDRRGSILIADCEFLSDAREGVQDTDPPIARSWRIIGDLLAAGGRMTALGEDLAVLRAREASE